ncbi:MAG: PP2C family protein-serine/threonine phosphatase [Acidimicrobiia bacterium]
MEGDRAVRQTSLRVRLGLVALVFLVVVLVAVGMSTLLIRSWDRTLDRRGEVRQAANEIAELRLAFTDQETGIRGYVLGRDPVFLEPYDDGDAVARALLERLHARELPVDGFEDELADVAMAADLWRTQVAEPTVADPTSPPDEDLARIHFDTLRTELDELSDLVGRGLAELDRETQQVRRNVFGVLFASAVTAIAGTALAAMLFRRWVIRPLHRIGTAARALAEDDTYPLPQFDSPELQDVSDAVGSLQRSLRTARDEAVAAFSGLEQSAVLALQVRTQLANEIGQLPPGWTADSMLIPAEGVVAGDCFDLGLLDADHLYVIMVDVTGHGASAALDALKAKSQLRAALRSRFAPGPAIDWLSREMLKDEHTDLLTASVAVINLSTGTVRYANAGHPPALVTDGDVVHELEPTGPLVGAFDAAWSTAEATLPEGWTLIVHTDGVTDIVGDERERFGDDRFRACFDDTDPTTLLECVRVTTDEFRVGPRTDDCTAIAIHRLLPAASEEAAESGETLVDERSADEPAPDEPGSDDMSERTIIDDAERDTVLP